VESALTPPAARTVYELTERGRQLESVLLDLGSWGIPLLNGERGEVPSTTAVLLGLRAFFRPEVTTSTDERYAVRVGPEALTAMVQHGRLEFVQAPRTHRPPRSKRILARFSTSAPAGSALPTRWTKVCSGSRDRQQPYAASAAPSRWKPSRPR
jgi:hypothetical protein